MQCMQPLSGDFLFFFLSRARCNLA